MVCKEEIGYLALLRRNKSAHGCLGCFRGLVCAGLCYDRYVQEGQMCLCCNQNQISFFPIGFYEEASAMFDQSMLSQILYEFQPLPILDLPPLLDPIPEQTPNVARREKRSYTCRLCHAQGHNQATCTLRNQ